MTFSLLFFSLYIYFTFIFTFTFTFTYQNLPTPTKTYQNLRWYTMVYDGRMAVFVFLNFSKRNFRKSAPYRAQIGRIKNKFNLKLNQFLLSQTLRYHIFNFSNLLSSNFKRQKGDRGNAGTLVPIIPFSRSPFLAFFISFQYCFRFSLTPFLQQA